MRLATNTVSGREGRAYEIVLKALGRCDSHHVQRWRLIRCLATREGSIDFVFEVSGSKQPYICCIPLWYVEPGYSYMEYIDSLSFWVGFSDGKPFESSLFLGQRERTRQPRWHSLALGIPDVVFRIRQNWVALKEFNFSYYNMDM